MAARYVEVTKEEFDGLMKSALFFPARLPGVGEVVYQRPVEHVGENGVEVPVLDLAVRIYSTVPLSAASARDVGADAIRVQVVHLPTGKIVWAATRVHRTQNWAATTIERMREAWSRAKKTPACPKCGKPMAVRTVKDGSGRQFRGCVAFPDCRGTRPF